MSIKFSDVFSSSQFDMNNPKVDEFINKTKDVAQAVGRKGAEHIELSKKKLECLDIKSKLSKLYEKFGRLHYSAFIGEDVDEEQINQIADEIAEYNEKLDLIYIEINEVKSNME